MRRRHSFICDSARAPPIGRPQLTLLIDVAKPVFAGLYLALLQVMAKTEGFRSFAVPGLQADEQ